MNEKLFRANVTVLAVYPEAFPDPNKPVPTTTILNNQFDFAPTADRSNMVFNISCAITDDSLTANISDPETSSARSICDESEVETPTFQVYETSFDAFRHVNVVDENLYNLFFWLFNGPDRPYYIVTRIGKNSDEAFAIGDDVNIFGVVTDNPVDVVEDNEELRFGARFHYTGFLAQKVRLVA